PLSLHDALPIWAYDDTPVFKLKRKLERQKKKPDSETRASFRKIVDVQEVESVPVKCIQVDNESKLYLAGKSFIPTHNTSLIGALSLYHLVCRSEEHTSELQSRENLVCRLLL